MAARNISDALSVSISLIQPDPFRGQSSSAPNFMEFGRSDSTNSDEGVVMADGHTVLIHSASLGMDVSDCDLNRKRSSIVFSESSTDDGDMAIARNRLNSFVDWPLAYLRPSAMSAAGLFYTGRRDFVKCAFCEGVLGNWRLVDDPVEEHRRHFPRCSFVASLPSGAPPTDAPSTPSTPSVSGSSGSDTEMTGEDVCGFYFPCRNPQPVLVPAAPSVPQMALYKDRFATFAGWPREKSQTPRDLAAAGLFYTGEGDQTQCFHCSGNLHCWDAQDNPWTEHARFYPTCLYLIASQGHAFIDHARRGVASSPEAQPLHRASLTNSSSGSPPSSSHSSGFEDELPSSHESGSFSDRSMSDEECEQGVIGQAVMCNSHLMDAIQEAVRENRQNLSFSRFRSSEHLLQAAKAIQTRKELQKELMAKESERVVSVIPSDMTSLTKEYERLKNERVCKVCLDRESQFIFHPCGHLVCCARCAEEVQKCPVCRTLIAHKSRVYLS